MVFLKTTTATHFFVFYPYLCMLYYAYLVFVFCFLQKPKITLII